MRQIKFGPSFRLTRMADEVAYSKTNLPEAKLVWKQGADIGRQFFLGLSYFCTTCKQKH